jgi:hypothetical protein
MKIFDLLTEWNLFENKEEIYKKFYSDIDRDVFIKIISADPKTIIKDNEIKVIGKYSKILLDMYKNGNLLLEDLPKANEYFTVAYKYNIPINSKEVENLSDIYNLVKDRIAMSKESVYSLMELLDEKDYKNIEMEKIG